MKSIKLEESEETHEGHQLKFSDKKLLAEIINRPVEGISVAEMRERIKLLDKIEAAEETLELEDSEFDKMKSLVEGFKFGIVSKHVLALCDKFSV